MEVYADEEDFEAKAALRYERTESEGVDGVSYTPQGRNDIELGTNLQIMNLTKLDSILAWLDGPGEFIFKGRKTNAQFLSELKPSRMVYLKQIPVTFIRDPYWYLETESDQTITDFPAVIVNSGNADTWPLLKITGTGLVDITLNGFNFTYDFDTAYVYLECAQGLTRNAYFGTDRKNRKKTGSWPYLSPGNNTLTVNSGTVAEIVVTKRSRFL